MSADTLRHASATDAASSTPRPLQEQDACGVGFITNIHQPASHQNVQLALQALEAYRHRGAISYDGTGDGAGILTQIPQDFFHRVLSEECGLDVAESQPVGVGMFFLPQNKAVVEQVRKIAAKALVRHGLNGLVWRRVPVDTEGLSDRAQAEMPQIEQLCFEASPEQEAQVEACRMEIEAQVAALGGESSQMAEALRHFSVPSMSAKTIVYKGLLRPDQLRNLYPDLSAPDYISRLAVYHARFSTNTMSTWAGAQPGRHVAHNGEINTIGNNERQWLNRMAAMEVENFSFGSGLSDSLRFDRALEQLLREGKSLTQAMYTLVPPAWRSREDMPQSLKDFFAWQSLGFEPWDGPAAMVITDGDAAEMHLDRSGLRPARYTILKDGTVIAGSEEGVLPVHASQIYHRGSLRSGQSLRVDPTQPDEAARIIDGERELEQQVQSIDYAALLASRTERLPEADFTAISPEAADASLRLRRQAAYGWYQEVPELFIAPMAETGKEKVFAMGDDTPHYPLSRLAVELPRAFKQRFAQVTNPPIDSQREKDVMSLAVGLGPRIEAASETASQILLDSPILRPGQLDALAATGTRVGAALPMLFTPGADKQSNAASLAQALEQLADAAERQVRAGQDILVISDAAIDDNHAAIPAVLAVAAINQRLEETKLRRRASVVVDTGQVSNAHEAALLLGFGASAVNPHMLYQETRILAEEQREKAKKANLRGKGPKIEPLSDEAALENVVHSMDAGLLKIMSKMGICTADSYIGGRNFEAVGLDLQDPVLGKLFAGVSSPMGGHGLAEIAENYAHFHRVSLETTDKLPHIRRFRNNPGKEGQEHHGFNTTARELFNKIRFTEFPPTPEAYFLSLQFAVQNLTSGALELFRSAAEEMNLRERIETMYADGSIREEEQQLALFSEWFDLLSDEAKGMLASDELARNLLDGIKQEIKEPAADRGAYTEEEINGFRRSESYLAFKRGVEELKQTNPASFADVLAFSPQRAIDVSEVQETNASILAGHVVSGAMSHGALTGEAHTAIATAMNRMGARSNSGEGGTKRETRPLDAITRSKIVQAASARFGLDASYLAAADEIEIKIAQGAKPGEGGQLPGEKVTVEIATQRGGIPGVELISPPPHHDIYSIEDLSQLIYDLRSAGKRVGVKLVASEGIEVVAAGVAKALIAGGLDDDGIAGTINIAGNSGGTGASPITSIHYAGNDSLAGLANVDRVLREQGLRDVVKLRVSGGFKTGQDLVKATILGADEWEIGTSALIPLGCVMARNCNIPTLCPPNLMSDGKGGVKFKEDPRQLEYYLGYLADDVRHELAGLGARTLEEIRGRRELLKAEIPAFVRGRLDVSPMLQAPEQEIHLTEEHLVALRARLALDPRRDDGIWQGLKPVIETITRRREEGDDREIPQTDIGSERHPVQLSNSDRSVGGKIAVEMARLLQNSRIAQDPARLVELQDLVVLHTAGAAGQSYGVFTTTGMKLEHTGVVQDGFAKGQSGGTVVIRPEPELRERAGELAIGGNVGLYGAKGGRCFVSGRVGDRFAVRNSGAEAVVEGVGDFACEYMTSGTVLNLGPVGNHFGVGMSGGIAIQYDPTTALDAERGTVTGTFADRLNPQLATYTVGNQPMLEHTIRSLLEEHAEQTGSVKAQSILQNWEVEKHRFTIVIPRAMERALETSRLDTTLRGYHDRATLSRGEVAKLLDARQQQRLAEQGQSGPSLAA
jgi:glutamate synthase (NADPH/NADH) large chain